MFKTIFQFELVQQLKRPFIWVACFLMFIQGIYYMQHSSEFYANDETFANAPAIFFTVFAGVGYVGFIVTAIVAGAVLTKDLQSRFSAILFTTSATENGYFWGRYAAGFTIISVLNVFYLLGVICYSFLPVRNLGPVNYDTLGLAVLYILIPNTFILFTFCFVAAAITRRIGSSYMAAMIIMLIMIFAVSMREVNRGAAFYDPTAFGVLADDLEHMSPAEKNVYLPAFTGNLMLNRLGWVALGILALISARKRFTFKYFSKSTATGKQENGEAHIAETGQLTPAALIPVKPRFSTFLNWKNVFSLSLTELKSVVAPTGFKIFLAILLIVYVAFIAVWQQQYYSAAPTLPVTVEVTNVTIAMSFYFTIFITVNTVELLFRNQTSEFWKIADALPVPSWVTVLSKMNAMILVSLLLSVCLIGFGMAVQAAKGYFDFGPEVYFNEIILRWLPKYIALILLCVTVAGISGNKYATHGICILVVVVTVILHELDVLEQNRFQFAFAPGSLKYTDMNGKGIFGPANLWYSIYWISFSLTLALAGLLAWPRGLLTPLFRRLRFRGRAQTTLLTLCILSAGIFVYAADYIYRTVNIQNEFTTIEQDRESDAAYEKHYKVYQHTPQPHVRHINMAIDLFPQKREMRYSADMELINPHSAVIDTLHVEWEDFLEITGLSIDGNDLPLLFKDEDLRHALYKLPQPLVPGTPVRLHVTAHKHYKGFTNGDPQKDLVYNGTFLSESLLPFFGYDDRRELAENKYREDYGLKKITSGLPPADDLYGSKAMHSSTQAQQITFNCVVSTDSSQTVVMPGILEKKWRESGRNFFRFSSGKPVPFRFNLLSASYASKTKEINLDGRPVLLEVFCHPGHPYNTDAWLTSAAEALQFLQQHLGPYPYDRLVIAERPRYDEELFALANLVVLPENHGWIADIGRNEDLDYLRYITTRLIAEQYLQRGNFSRVQGYPFLTKSIPGYLALMQLDSFYGKASVDSFLENNHDKYLKGRAGSDKKEPALLMCDENEDYIYNHKGIAVLYETGQKTGQKALLNQISAFYKSSLNTDRKLNTLDWYDQLKNIPGADPGYLQSAFVHP